MKYLPLSYIEISKNNLIHNIKEFRKIINKETKLAVVVKANAYGHGDVVLVKILNPYVDYFQINSFIELERVAKVSKKPILLFGYVGKNDISKAIKIGCILSVFDLSHALLINENARKLGKIQKVHISIDSHLGREGILPDDLILFIKEIKKMKNIKVDGIYSHFSNIEDTMNFSHSQKQIDIYHKCVDIFNSSGFDKINTHISATSGILVYENKNISHSIVRLGIGLYGLWPSEHLKFLNKKKVTLKPILRWITHVAQIKSFSANYPIGYGLTYITKKKTKVAIIPQGYSDGLSRSLSNNGEVLIRGKRAKIIGRIAMNMMVVDISHIKNAETEDEVVVLGTQDKSIITAEDIAQKSNTINYEVTTRISPLLPKIVV